MSQIQFKQITFDGRGAKSANTNLLGTGKDSGYRIFRYPLDIGAYDKGHYMVIHINEQRETQFSAFGKDEKGLSDNPTVIQNRKDARKGGATSGGQPLSFALRGAQDLATLTINEASADGKGAENVGGEIKTSLDAAKQFVTSQGGPVPNFLVGAGQAIFNEFTNIVGQAQSETFRTDFTRTIKRTKDTIVLYMPDTMAFNYGQGYNEMNVGADSRLLGMIGVGADIINDPMPKKSAEVKGQAVGAALTPFLLSFLADKSDLGKTAFAALTGTVLNPMIELIYSTPQLRNFRFDFMLYPRNEKEAREVNRILDCLRFHQAPEVLSDNFITGNFLVPPSEFDIEFYYNGSKNPNIDSISTCVLESIDVDYAPNGFSAYEVDGQVTPKSGGTGMPVGIRLSLSFKETEYRTKADYQHYVTERNSVSTGQYGVQLDAPYDAFDSAQSVNLEIGQGINGNYESDLPQAKQEFQY